MGKTSCFSRSRSSTKYAALEWEDLLICPSFLFPTYSFLRFYLFIFRERGKERERGGEKHQLVASRTPATRDLAHNPGMCPDQNQTSDLSVHGPALHPLCRTSQGSNSFLLTAPPSVPRLVQGRGWGTGGSRILCPRHPPASLWSPPRPGTWRVLNK